MRACLLYWYFLAYRSSQFIAKSLKIEKNPVFCSPAEKIRFFLLVFVSKTMRNARNLDSKNLTKMYTLREELRVTSAQGNSPL